MQAIKAGVLEIADLLVVNKADLPDADSTAGHLKAMLHYRGHAETRSVLLASMVTGDGLRALVDAINARFSGPAEKQPDDPDTVSPKALADDAAELVRAFVRYTNDAAIGDICVAIGRGEILYRDGLIAAVKMFVESCGTAAGADAYFPVGS
jgi:putative protein kinase ArgK-like GTPase of G3E family